MTADTSDRSYAREVQRARFLRSVEKLVPKVLESLRVDVHPLFQALFTSRYIPEHGESGYELSFDPMQYLCIKWKSDAKTIRESLERPIRAHEIHWSEEFSGEQPADRVLFRDRAVAWAKGWNLSDDWILNQVLATLLWWIGTPADKARNGWGDIAGYMHTRDDPRPPTLGLQERWGTEPWDKVERRILKKLAAYKQSFHAYSESVGYDPDGVGNSLHHYDWLALYQCKRLSPAAIREEQPEPRPVESAITHAIKEVSDRIGLKRRQTQRGRKKT